MEDNYIIAPVVEGQVYEPVVKVGDTLPIGTEVDYDGSSVPNGWQEIDDPNDYSTTEQVIGKWKDGKPLYRKVVNTRFGTVEQGTETTAEVNLKNVDFILVDKYWLDRKTEFSIINQGYVADALYLGYTSFSNSNTTLRFRTKQSWASNMTVYAIVEYTKTTD